jgi:hypothetical protein
MDIVTERHVVGILTKENKIAGTWHPNSFFRFSIPTEILSSPNGKTNTGSWLPYKWKSNAWLAGIIIQC